jgi:hypothetical protein
MTTVTTRYLPRGPRTTMVRCFCRNTFRRPVGETYKTCLECQTRRRTERAGISPYDPALLAIAEWNATVRAAAASRQARADRAA